MGLTGIVLAAGKGVRMKPLSNLIPKPMLPLGCETLVHRAVRCLNEICTRVILINRSNGPLAEKTSDAEHITTGYEGDYHFQHLLILNEQLGDEFVILASDCAASVDSVRAVVEKRREVGAIASLIIDESRKFPLKILSKHGHISSAGPRLKQFNRSSPCLFCCDKRFLQHLSPHVDGNWELFSRILVDNGLSWIHRADVFECNTPEEYLHLTLQVVDRYVCPRSRIHDSVLESGAIYDSSLEIARYAGV
jgi:NDP-sugar pyrophosphorylase family protein